MNQCTVHVQSNLKAIESAKIQKACEGLGVPVHLFKVIPFSNRLPRIGAKPPFIMIGSTTLNRLCLKSKKYRSGVFFNDNFKPSVYQSKWGAAYLNYDQQIFKLKDIPHDLYDPNCQVFMRSNDDSKEVSGGVGLFGKLLEMQKVADQHWVLGDLFTPDSELCIAPVRADLYAEYRTLFCQGQLIGYSRYRPSVEYGVPQDILDFACSMQQVWQPHEVFVLDIVETDDGPRVMECNCLNGSGWYDADYAKILDAIVKYQEDAHQVKAR